MKSALGVILTGWKKPGLKELAEIRSGSAIPVGGKYRAIDFPLSSMVNTGITKIAVITQYSYRSLMDHLGSGKEWDMDRRKGGLFVFPPITGNDDTGIYFGSADAMYKNIEFFKRSYEDFVVIAQGNCIYNMNFSGAIDLHARGKADITLLYRHMSDYPAHELRQLGIVKMDSDSRIRDLQEKPDNPESMDASLGIYIIGRKLLISLLEKSAAHGKYDFVKGILIDGLDSLGIYGYRYRGYWRNLNTIETYYRANMEMLNPGLLRALFIRKGKVFTKVKDETPAKYNEEAEVSNSIIADGCIIEGTVENSVLFRGVSVKRGSVIKNSIIMQNSTVDEMAQLDKVILDKNVIVTRDKRLKGDDSWPVVVGKNTVI